jgi:hypothetical protein
VWFDELSNRAMKVTDEHLAVQKAKAIGTYNALDRSRQYTQPENPELLRSLNEAWSKIRTCEKELRTKDQDIQQLRKRLKSYRVANIALTSVITGLAWEGLKALIALIHR